jgi:hypothetical protein
MTISIDWNKLSDYKFDKRKSFEELCFQIAYENYSNEGTFISIDDSGGGSGVEFYLVRPNGGVWGWQAKFYPHGRFTKTRRAQVKKSLAQSLKDHKKLEKWLLCSPTDFTTLGKNPEHKWFHEKLKKIAPGTELIFWGERFLINQLATPKLLGRRLFFFGDLELSSQWCRNQVTGQLAAIGNKYLPGLHTQTTIDDDVSDALGDSDALLRLSRTNGQLRKAIVEIQGAVSALDGIKAKWPESYESSVICASNVSAVFQSALTVGELFNGLVAGADVTRGQSMPLPPNVDQLREAVASLKLDDIEIALNEAKDEKNESKSHGVRSDYQIAGRPSQLAQKYWGSLFELRAVMERFRSSTLNVLGSAGYGKTHMACAIADKRTQIGLPTMLLRGIRFTREIPIKQQILSLLDIPTTYSWEDFLSALDAMSAVYRTRVCLIIDGLNEAENLKRWQVELPEIAADIKRYQRILVVTTCRSNYSDLIWPQETHTPSPFLYLYAADGDTLEQMAAKYFDFYHLAVTTAFASLRTLSNPLYLRLFCEANNPERTTTISVHLADQTMLRTLRKYLAGVWERIGRDTDRPNARSLVEKRLRNFAKQLWQLDVRELPLSVASEILDQIPPESPQFRWNRSITKALIDEDLVITRERGFPDGSEEVIRFTYDLLAGLLIAEGIIENLESKQAQSIFASGIPSLTDKQHRHPLWDDITRCLCLVTPERVGGHVYDATANATLFSASVNALYEMDPGLIRPRDARLVEALLKIESNRKSLLSRLWETATVPDHPLNATLLDRVLHRMEIADRELAWTENLREHSARFHKFLSELWNTLSNFKNEDRANVERIKLSGILTKWLLTSTEHRLRDNATRTLTRIGMRVPRFLFAQTLSSLAENDPYVPERMLAAAYATIMRLHCKPEASYFREIDLPYFAKSLYWLMFATDARHPTTHALTREYARGVLECAQKYHPTLLHYASRTEDGRIKFPRSPLKWRKFEFPPQPDEYVNSPILGMDWGNYTLGHLVPSRSSYEFSHPGYATIRRNVLWRVHELGYDPTRFSTIDREIAHFHWRGTDQQGRTDRYGKKYAWIAYFELYGLLYDAGELRDEWLGRPRRPVEFDIDPTFPRARQVRVTHERLLQEFSGSPSNWLRLKSAPKHVKPLLVSKTFTDDGSEWILLDGWQSNYSKARAGNSFCMIRTFIVPRGQEERLIGLFRLEKPRGGWLDQKEEERGIFGGEIPWSLDIPPDELKEIEFTIGTRKVWRNPASFDSYLRGVPIPRKGGKIRDTVPVHENFDALIPVRSNEFSTRSPLRRDNAMIPSQSLLLHAGLSIRLPYWDLYDNSGKLAAAYVRFGGHYDSQHFTYYRKDLFDKFLTDRTASLVWVIWGERQLLTPSGGNQGYRQYKELHKYRAGRP